MGGAFVAFNFISSGVELGTANKEFIINKGESFNSIAKNLEKQGVITNAFYFKILGRLSSKTSALKQGEYAIKNGLTPVQVLEILSSGKSIQYSVTIPEGTNLYEIAQLLEAKGLASSEEFIKLCKNTEFIKKHLGQAYESLEGYLFPETYAFTKSVSVKTIVETMLSSFIKNYKMITQSSVQLSARDQVILASMIEKETGAAEERRVISSVFHNRLKKGMRFESDPTIIYGIAEQTGVMPTNITKKDIRTKTKYNTYRIKGLPAGPITNPGKEALFAAVNPVSSKYLFFVSKNDGTHIFTENFKDHLKAVRVFQLNPRARQGKSWRDRSK